MYANYILPFDFKDPGQVTKFNSEEAENSGASLQDNRKLHRPAFGETRPGTGLNAGHVNNSWFYFGISGSLVLLLFLSVLAGRRKPAEMQKE